MNLFDYVLLHWDRSCGSNLLSCSVKVYWHLADQSKRWPWPGIWQSSHLSHLYDSTWKKIHRNRTQVFCCQWDLWESNPSLVALKADTLPRQWSSSHIRINTMQVMLDLHTIKTRDILSKTTQIITDRHDTHIWCTYYLQSTRETSLLNQTT